MVGEVKHHFNSLYLVLQLNAKPGTKLKPLSILSYVKNGNGCGWRSKTLFQFIISCITAKCKAGNQIKTTVTPFVCEECEFGYYQEKDQPITEKCQQCPTNQWTEKKGTDKKSLCKRKHLLITVYSFTFES